MQLLLVATSPNYTVLLKTLRPSLMWNSIVLAPREHTSALTLRWHFWGRGSENHTFWALFALKTQLLLVAPSPNFTDHLIWVRPTFMWNGISVAPWEHTSALTLGPSQLTLVGALTRKPLGQSLSNSLCFHDL